MARDFYAEANPLDLEIHPVDAAVERRLQQKAELRRIRRAVDQLMKALGKRRALWFEVEQLKGNYHLSREEEYFRLGYERGLAAGRADVLRARAGRGTSADRNLAARVRDVAAEADVPLGHKVAAILETAWALVIGEGTEGARAASRGRIRKKGR